MRVLKKVSEEGLIDGRYKVFVSSGNQMVVSSGLSVPEDTAYILQVDVEGFGTDFFYSTYSGVEGAVVLVYKEGGEVTATPYWSTSLGASYTRKGVVNHPIVPPVGDLELYDVTQYDPSLAVYPYSTMFFDEDSNGYLPGMMITSEYATVFNKVASEDVWGSIKGDPEYEDWSDFAYRYSGVGDYSYTIGYRNDDAGVFAVNNLNGELSFHPYTTPDAPVRGDATLPAILPNGEIIIMWDDNDTTRRLKINPETWEETELETLPFVLSSLWYYGEYWNTFSSGIRFSENKYWEMDLSGDSSLLQLDIHTHEVDWRIENLYSEFPSLSGMNDHDLTDIPWYAETMIVDDEIYTLLEVDNPDNNTLIFLVKFSKEDGSIVTLNQFDYGDQFYIEEIFALGQYLVMVVQMESMAPYEIHVFDTITGQRVHIEDSYPIVSQPATTTSIYSTANNTGVISLINIGVEFGEVLIVYIDFDDFTFTFKTIPGDSRVISNMFDEDDVMVSMSPAGNLAIVDGNSVLFTGEEGKEGLRRRYKPTVGYHNLEGLTPGYHNPWTDANYRPEWGGVHRNPAPIKLTVGGVEDFYSVSETRVSTLERTLEFFTYNGVDFSNKAHEINFTLPAGFTYGNNNIYLSNRQSAVGNLIFVTDSSSTYRARVNIDTGEVTTVTPHPAGHRSSMGMGIVEGVPVFVGTYTGFSGTQTSSVYSYDTGWQLRASLPGVTGNFSRHVSHNGTIYFINDSYMASFNSLSGGWTPLPTLTDPGYTVTLGNLVPMVDSQGRIHFVNMIRTNDTTGERNYVAYMYDPGTSEWSLFDVMSNTLMHTGRYNTHTVTSPYFKISGSNIAFISSLYSRMYYVLP